MKMEDMIMVSVDDHVVEPPHLFDDHADPKFKDRMPQLVRRADDTQVWKFEGRTLANVALNAVVGRRKEDYAAEPTNFEQIRKGTWDIDARIDDMDANGQLAGMNFPSLFGMAGQVLIGIEDKDVAYAACRAWNDWHIDEWCARHPGRMIPLGILPLWDPELSAREARRLAGKGCHAVSFPPNPHRDRQGTFHDGHWDPLFKVCDENEIVMCLHFADAEAAVPSPDCPIDTWISNMQLTMYLCASDVVFSPVLRKFKNIRFALSEGSIGWVPYFLERVDVVHGIHSTWTNQHFPDLLPSELFKKHIQTCFIQDATGLKLRHDIGVDNITWECDYPHADTVWPNCPEVLWPSVAGFPDDEINRITHLNAMRWYNFDPFKHIKPEEATVGALRARAKAKGVDLSPMDIKGGSWALHAPDRPISFQDVVDQMKRMGTVSDSTGMGRVAKKMESAE